MKKNFTICCLLLALSVLHSQTVPGFNLRFTTQYPNTRIFKVLIENDTIVVLGDGYEDSTALNRGIVLMKLDTLGNLLHAKHIYDSLFAVSPMPLRWGSLLSTADGGYIMNITPHLSEYPTILKTDHDFNLEFIKNYQEPGDYGYQLCDMLPISDGYLLFGLVGRANGFSDGYLRKIGVNGDSIWLKNFGNPNSSEGVNDVVIINDTLFAVAIVKAISTSSAISTIKLVNGNGDNLQQWNSQPNPEIGYLREILSADDDGYLVYGLYPLEFLPPFDYLIQSTLSRLDQDFNVLWSKRYGKKYTLSSEIMFYNFERTIDDNYVGVGKTFIDQPSGYPVLTGWLMKFSPEGDSIWSRLDTSDLMPWHFLNNHVLGGVGVLSSGSIVAGGYARHLNDYYAWLVKVTNDGCLDTLYCGLVSGVEEVAHARSKMAKVYPNPAGSYLEMDYEASYGTPSKVILTDLLGRNVRIFDFDVSKTHQMIALSGLPNGQYFYTILENGQRVQAGKFIKLE